MPDKTIILDKVNVEFEGLHVLQDITLCLTEQRIGIIGANGSGKSTFIRLLNGLVRPSSGRITIDQLELPRDTNAVRRKVGFTFQNPEAQIIMPTVIEDIAFGLKNLNLSETEISKRSASIMKAYGLQSVADKPARTLSGGQKQLLALCGVLAMQPDIIVLDEPSTQLDLRYKRRLAVTLQQLSQRLILTTHDLDLLDGFDRILVIDNGQIACDNSPQKAIPFYKNLILNKP